ncbi:hypothetical protein Ahu01nite_052580 [Winogradskya humida]|uniref:Uncharacterized protein n=1 Tax=Winogradskya humida TaxID=113566 RepID=A0ABQ3ZU87_9ACTN|nr:hypothetical protein Ahu01nite_052580 [Actinoplanes humidus]
MQLDRHLGFLANREALPSTGMTPMAGSLLHGQFYSLNLRRRLPIDGVNRIAQRLQRIGDVYSVAAPRTGDGETG